ncbi:MAG TPA: FtsX-like permease family protein [Solirubrobacteraceae bacterium]|jgi:putative ABC transport system permease protein|nr:FtsX-like permease family protein [Solirubrobacteraceae bacterium]
MNRALLADRRSLRSPIGLRPSMLVFLYRRRLRAHPVQELLAGTGIAVGVALVFGVLLANAGLTGSTERFVRALAGSARLTLLARSPAGFPERLIDRVRALPGVQVATSVLRENMTVEGPRSHQAVQLIGVSPSLASLGGIAQQELGNGALLLSGGLGLPGGVAQTIGAQRGSRVDLVGNGARHGASVGAVIGSEAVKALAGCPVVVALLGVAQRLAGRPGRVTQTLIVPARGHDAQVVRELRALAGGRLDVEPAGHELQLLSQATVPNRQSTSLFSAISVMVGFLLALNAMLLTVPERRRFIAELRMQGYDPRQILLMLAFQAVALGLVASVIGVMLGDVLARTLYHQVPSYLAVAFPIAAEQSLSVGMALAAVACGVLATLLASLSPVLDLRPSLPADSVFREAGPSAGLLSVQAMRWCGLAGLIAIALVGAAVAIVPSLTIFGGVALAAATVLLIPPMLVLVAHWFPRLTVDSHSGAAILAASELRAISTRSVALGAIVALAVYGSVAIGGTRDDLLHGIETATAQYHRTADLWVADGSNVFNTDGFPAAVARRLARVAAVDSVRVYRGGLIDVGPRRLWVRARPTEDPTMFEASQILSGDFAQAQALIRRGGWAAVSSGFAGEHGLVLGSRLLLPTPSGSAAFRVAAITTNSGWPAGTITLSAPDYARWWGSAEATALELDLRPGVAPAAAARAVRAALGPGTGLLVQTSAQSAVRADASARQGLRTLSDISTMLLIAAALAVAAALSTTVWQRRARLASLKIQGYHAGQLWLGLLIESVVMIALGSLVGAAVGVYGHALAAHWLTITTGFPAPFSIGGAHVFLTFALVTAIATAVISLPGMAAARVPPRMSLQE